MKKIGLFLKFLFILFVIVSCSEKKSNWVKNGSKIYAEHFRIELSDSSEILRKNQNGYFLISLPKTASIGNFEVNYSEVSPSANKYFRYKANQQVIRSDNPQITEYYDVQQTYVLFVGYSIDNPEKSITIFEPPLCITSDVDMPQIISEGKIEKFTTVKNGRNEEQIITMSVKTLGKINIITDKGENLFCTIKDITIRRNGLLNYCKNTLLVSNAIITETKVLTDKSGYPIMEWRIRQKNNNDFYIELTKYYKN